MTLLELKDKKGLLIEENRQLMELGQAESRKLTDEEEQKFNGNLDAIKELQSQIEAETRKETKVLIKKESRKMEKIGLMKAIRNIAERGNLPEEMRELHEEGRNEFSKAGVESSGQFSIPMESRAAIVTGQTTGTTAGGYAIQTDKLQVLPPLTNYMVLSQAGATYLNGLVGNVSIPTYSGTTVLWKGEVASATDGAGTWGYVNMNPKRLTAFLDVSKMFLLQDSVGAEKMLMENIARAVAVKLESTILGVGAGSVSTEPTGLFYSGYTSDHTAASYTAAVNLERNVDYYNALTNNLAYITHPYGRAKLKTTAKVSSSDSIMVSDGKEMNGYPLLVSNSCAYNVFTTTGSAGLIFGNWADLLIGQWGGYDLTIDPYTQAALGTVRIVVNCYFDAAAARSTSFSAINITV